MKSILNTLSTYQHKKKQLPDVLMSKNEKDMKEFLVTITKQANDDQKKLVKRYETLLE